MATHVVKLTEQHEKKRFKEEARLILLVAIIVVFRNRHCVANSTAFFAANIDLLFLFDPKVTRSSIVGRKYFVPR